MNVLHSRFKIPVSNEPTLSCRVSLGSPTAHLIKSAALILWDEAVMSSRFNFEAVDRLLEDIMGADDPTLEHVLFGGKVVVFGGDFRQILPVVPNGTPAQIIADCITSFYIWQGVKVLTLVENMRVRGANQEAVDFARMLLAVGNGDPPYQDHMQIPHHWLLDSEDASTLINKIYPPLSLSPLIRPSSPPVPSSPRKTSLSIGSTSMRHRLFRAKKWYTIRMTVWSMVTILMLTQ
jgi:hypothetical protein